MLFTQRFSHLPSLAADVFLLGSHAKGVLWLRSWISFQVILEVNIRASESVYVWWRRMSVRAEFLRDLGCKLTHLKLKCILSAPLASLNAIAKRKIVYQNKNSLVLGLTAKMLLVWLFKNTILLPIILILWAGNWWSVTVWFMQMNWILSWSCI